MTPHALKGSVRGIELQSDSNPSESAAAHLDFLAKHLKLGFYAKGEIITELEA